MALPVPNLDDRHFQDIVDEAKGRITSIFPEWTNHNLSDPGVALIELFAWMAEMTLYRVNQIPERVMATVLNTFGYRTLPPVAASVDLTFYLDGEQTEAEVPKGTPVGTSGLEGEQLVFETTEVLRIRQPGPLRRCLAQDQAGSLVDRTADLVDPSKAVECFQGLTPDGTSSGTAIYFGFDDPLSNALVQLQVEVSNGLGIVPTDPPLVWEVSTLNGYSECTLIVDGTGGLNRPGEIQLAVPAGHRPAILEGSSYHWLRLRLDTKRCEQYEQSPSMRSMQVRTIGGVVRASHAENRDGEVLGESNGEPGQRFSLSSHGILDHSEVKVFVGEEQWHQVDDFGDGNWRRIDDGWLPQTAPEEEPAAMKVFTIDPASGEIVFGQRVRSADGSTRQYGAIPGKGSRISASGYRVGGGQRGNEARAGTISVKRTTVPHIASISNRTAASGGVDAETIDEAIARAPISVRAGDRAVTASDYERLVRDVARDVARVDARSPSPATPVVPLRLLVVPKVSIDPSEQRIDDYALSAELAEMIRDHLEPRRLVGARVEITTPYYLGVSVAARITTAASIGPADRDDLRSRVLERLYRYINPITGGDVGNGLPYDVAVTAERIESLLLTVDGVASAEVVLFEANLRADDQAGTSRRGDEGSARVGGGRRRLQLPPDTLALSYRHKVVFVDAEASAP